MAKKHKLKQAKDSFYRVFIKLNEYDIKREVFAQETNFGTAKKIYDSYVIQQIAVTLVKGRTPNQVLYKYDGK